MNARDKAYAYLAAALILGALMPVMLGMAVGSVNVYAFLFLTYMISIPPSVALVLLSERKKFFVSYVKNRKDFLVIAAIGLLNYAFLEYGLLYAEKTISASLAAVIYRTYPLLMLLFLPLVLRERISRRQVAALLMAFAGLYVAVSYGSSQFFDNAGYFPIVVMVTVALTSAIATVLVKRYTYDMQSSILIFNISNLLFFGLLFFLSGSAFGTFTASAVASALYVGVFYNVITGFMYYRSLRVLKTTVVTNAYFLSPFLTFLAAGILLGEPVEAYYIIVAVMVAFGMLIQRGDKKGGIYSRVGRSAAGFAIYDVTPAYSNTDNEVIHQYVKGKGRALAVKIPAEHAHKISRFLVDNREQAGRYGAVMYSDRDYPFDEKGEIEHIRAISGAGEGDSVLICAGKPEHSEALLDIAVPAIYKPFEPLG